MQAGAKTLKGLPCPMPCFGAVYDEAEQELIDTLERRPSGPVPSR
jgi:hypothetical protein